MDIVKLPKNFRDLCDKIRDGDCDALDALEAFEEKYPHQVAAVKAEVAYFELDHERAFSLDLEVLPWLEEWHYSNVSDEHMTAMTVAALRLGRQEELMAAFDREIARIAAENGRPQRDIRCRKLKACLEKGELPSFTDDGNHPYRDPEAPLTRAELWDELVKKEKKLSPDDVKSLYKLFYRCCSRGTARDAVEVFEACPEGTFGALAYQNAVARYLYLNEPENALRTAERLAASRLWYVAADTQVRPIAFLADANLRAFITEEAPLRRVREAAFRGNEV